MYQTPPRGGPGAQRYNNQQYNQPGGQFGTDANESVNMGYELPAELRSYAGNPSNQQQQFRQNGYDGNGAGNYQQGRGGAMGQDPRLAGTNGLPQGGGAFVGPPGRMGGGPGDTQSQVTSTENLSPIARAATIINRVLDDVKLTPDFDHAVSR